jgi:hypothetical protein
MSPQQPGGTGHGVARGVARLAGPALALGLFSAAMWFVWLGWDHQYYYVGGVAQGPYRAWQVLGCGVSVAFAAVLAQLRVRTVWAIFVLAAVAVTGFAVPWALDAASTDETGLWVVGLLLLLVGGGSGLLVLLTLTTAATRYVARARAGD